MKLFVATGVDEISITDVFSPFCVDRLLRYRFQKGNKSMLYLDEKPLLNSLCFHELFAPGNEDCNANLSASQMLSSRQEGWQNVPKNTDKNLFSIHRERNDTQMLMVRE